MQVQELFRQASEFFESNSYQLGLQLMTKCLAYYPNNSALYSNRALFHSQLGNIDSAVDDLIKSIDFNYLNYVAYFNLFSLLYNSGQIVTAFDNLCCSLSCLYLIRAKKGRKELDVQRSIKYAENNPDAHVLKALMYLQDGKNKLALNEIEWALDIQTHVPLCTKIKNIINRKLNPYSVSEIIEQNTQKKNFRLHTSYEPAEDYGEQIKDRVKQFNQIYDQLVNSQYGTITQKVPRLKIENDHSRVNNSRSGLISELSDIYQIRYRDVNMNKLSKEKDTQAPTTKQNLNCNNDSDLLLEDYKVQTSFDKNNQILFETDKKVDIDDNLLEDSLNDLEYQLNIQLDQKKQAENTENDQPKQVNLLQQDLLTEEAEAYMLNIKQPQAVDKITLSRQDVIKQFSPTQTISQNSSKSESVELYPLGNKKKIQFTIISAEIKKQDNKLKDLYLTGNYNSRKGQRIKTPNKKIENGVVRWFTSVPPTSISENIQTVSVKVFSKQYFSYEDQMLGEGQIQILKSGQMIFPIYFKNKVTGFVNIRVDLI